MTNNKKHAVIVAGGTGGHIYPALAFAKRWQSLGHAISWIGTQQGLEASIIPKQNIPLFFITVRGVRRSKLLAQIFALGMALYAICQAVRLLRRLKPDVVLGMGGYVSAPSIIAARCLDIPVVIHEQNAVAGKTNQLLARFSQKILTAFPNVLTRYNPIVIGNPVRSELIALTPRLHPHRPMRVLIVGGSRGASSLNKILPELLIHIPDIEIWHQTGEQHFEETKKQYQPYKISAYIDDMAAAYSWADVVICRAGAMTVFEIMSIGRPAIFIPYPYAVDDHQTANAKFLIDRCAGMLIQEKELCVDNLKHFLDALKEDLNYQRYARNVYAHRVIDADVALVDVCLGSIKS